MIPVNINAPRTCVIEHCHVAILAKHKAFSTEMMRIKALREAPTVSPAQPARADDSPTGGGSGGGAILGGEGAPGSGTGVPGAFAPAKPF